MMARRQSADQGADPLGIDRIDLNLLQVFDVVMVERHVTRAAARLMMTQSAVSNALNRLRRVLGDQLFLKAARGVDPTPRALELWHRIHHSIQELNGSLRPTTFDPAQTKQKFRISVVDLMASLLAPYLYRTVSTSAPHALIHFVPHDEELSATRLIRSEVDLAIGVRAPRLSVLQATPLWSEPYVVVARRTHALFKRPFSLSDFCEAPHVLVNLTGAENFESAVDIALANRGLSRNIRMSVNQFSVAATVLLSSDLLAVMPARFLTSPYARHELAIRPLPIPVSDVVIYMTWHRRNSTLPAHEWLEKAVLESAKEHRDEMKRLLSKGR